MKKMKMNYLAGVLLLSAVAGFASSEKANENTTCVTVPTIGGPNIDAECQYSPSIICCAIAAGSTSQYVRQTQNGTIVIIRRSTMSVVSIFGQPL